MTKNGTSKTSLFTYFKYGIAFFAGVIVNSNTVIENITKIPTSVQAFKETYLYDSKEMFSGEWSSDPEYYINSSAMGFDVEQPSMYMKMDVDDQNNIEGEIISERLCDALPLTWYITIESIEPTISNLLFDRVFYVKQLHYGEMETVAKMKLVKINKRYETIKFERIYDQTGAIPKYIVFGKNLPKLKEDKAKLSDYCLKSSQNILKKSLENKN